MRPAFTVNGRVTLKTTPHTWYRMQGCVVQRGIMNVRRELSWCRPNPCFILDSQFSKQVSNVLSNCGADRVTFMALSWMENPTDQDGLLPKLQLSPPFPLKGYHRRLNARPTSLISRAVRAARRSSIAIKLLM